MTTKILVNNLERKLFWILAGFLGITLSLYVYFVVSLTLSGVARDRAISLSREKTIQANALEQEYIQLQNSVTLARAEELGFKEVTVRFAGGAGNKFSLVQ